MSDDEKKLRIKIKSVQRLVKEREYYSKEINQLQDTVNELKQHEPDNYDIKKKEEILEETINTQKTTNTMIKKFTNELKMYMVPYLETGNLSQELIDEINSIQ